MGISTTSSENVVALHDSVTGWAFGPVFRSEAEAEDFLAFTADGPDLRTLTQAELSDQFSAWWGRNHPDE